MTKTEPVGGEWQDSIAVLPFRDLSPLRDQEHRCFGITEEINNRLTQLGILKVTSTSSVMRYKGTEKTPEVIGEELGVANILEGSLQIEGNLIRVKSTLVNAETSFQLWSNTYQQELVRFFDLQDAVSKDIAETFKMKLAPETLQETRSSLPTNMEAYEYFLKGNTALRSRYVIYENEEDLRNALESLPCCSTDEDGTLQADPLNLVVIGRGRTVHRALIRSGWDETGTMERSVAITEQYRYGPVSPFYLYGRPQDAAFRKTRETADERNHLRLWLSPIRYKGKQVWVGQISRDIKVRYIPNKFQIEPLVDEARTYILQDLWYSQTLAKFGNVKGVGAASMSKPRKTLQDDPYFTDGYRLVLWVSKKPISFSEVEALHWEIPPFRKKDF